ncbi:MAG: sigma 54-interacting transcriptional regulator [Planctomycetota bacterium]|nr:sigma 54-interacting transcriptional regulator [Planctomycetota bacterium]
MTWHIRCQRYIEDVYTYLTITLGTQTGTVFRLCEDAENRIGRGLECNVVLTDPLCSRVHATIHKEEDRWVLKDASSRNGSFLNEQKIDDATLVNGCHIRVGSTEFSFQQSKQPPEFDSGGDLKITQTIVKDREVNPDDAAKLAVAALQDSKQAQELLVLYQLSIKLMGSADPDEVVRDVLEVVHGHIAASVVGFLWVNEAGQLFPKLVVPTSTKDFRLSESLTELVCQQGRAVWIANQQANDSADSLRHFADALCIPLVHEGIMRGALHVYRENDRFRQTEFDFSSSAANILAVALARARRQTSLESDLQQLAAKTPGYDEMIGECRSMQELKTKIGRLAQATGCVLVRGESGTGKELVARAIHRASPRAELPLLSVNCAAIPADLIESQLFGHKAGAFTSADRDHVGYFQQADLGTLFLDEVGELPMEGQAKLLRILEGHPFMPIGDTVEVSVDVRVIAATNQNLETYVKEKRFREDLYYRLSVFELTLPPLSERDTDIELLIDAFLDHYRHQHGRPRLKLSNSARNKLLSYQWPGNVRQLRNVIDSAVVLADGNEIKPSDLGLREVGDEELDSLKISDWEKKLIQEALGRTKGNVVEAAKMLGIGRATLYRKLEEYGIQK